MSSEHHIKGVKLLVVSLAILFLGGTVLAGTLLIKKARQIRNADLLSSAECAGGEIDLKGRGIIVESRTEDQLLRLTLEKQTGSNEIVTIDTCTGKIVGTLKISTDPGMPALE